MIKLVMDPARRGWVLVVVATSAFEMLLVLKPGSRFSLAVSVGILLALVGLVAAVAAGLRRSREVEHLRRGWGLIGVACLLFAAGQVAFVLETVEEGRRPPTGHSVADIITALTVPFAVAGLVAFAGPSVTTRRVALLDGATVTVALLFVSWVAVLGPVYRTRGTGRAEVTTFIYVGGTIAMLALVLVLSMRWRGDMHELLLMGGAFAWLTVSNAGYGITNLRGTYQPGDWRIDVGWFGSLLLLVLAATRPPGPAAVDVRHRWFFTLFVPYAAVLLVVLTAAVVLATGRVFDRFEEADGIALVALVLARQVVTLREHHALTVDLERRVGERTATAQRYASQLRALLRDSSDVLAVVDEHGTFAYVSPASWSLFGLPAEDLVGQPFMAFVHPDDREATRTALTQVEPSDPSSHVVTFRVVGSNQHQSCDVEATFSAVKEDLPGAGVLLNMRDVTERTAEQEQLRKQALFDPLTSLPNRRVFDDRLHHALDRAQRSGECVSVLFVDLDHFKRVNDTAGHAIGDELLVQVADRLRVCLRPADTAARLGGDEFAVLLEGATTHQAQEVAARVVSALTPPYVLSDRTLVVTASVGVTTTEAGTVSTSQLVRDADVAMYRAKARGRARVEVFEAQTRTQRREQDELEDALRQALARGQMRVLYQPLVDLTTGRVTGMEALMRWQRSPGEEVLPSRFLPLAEPQGLLQDLDRWVLREACRQLRAWQQELPHCEGLRVHVNISVLDLHEPRVVQDLAALLEETGLAPSSLVLEIAESSVLPGESAVSDVLERIRDLGVEVWVDDFGSGFSSLVSLQRFPLDGLKIDRSFVAGLSSSASSRRLVGALLDMAQAFGLTTVGEAVETSDQEAWLRHLGCVSVQGLLYCPPLAPAAAAAFLASRTAAGAPSLLTTPTDAVPDGADDEP